MYQCSQCGGELKYHIESGNMHCAHCSHEISVESLQKDNRMLQEKYSIYSCPNCGGEIVTNDATIADFCSYCAAPVVLEKSEESRNMPTRIVPFQVTLSQCEEQYLNYIKKMPYVPKEYKQEEASLDFRGIYMPFHVYHVDIEGEIEYRGKTDKLINAKKKKHQVDIYKITKQVSGYVDNIIHDASDSFSDRISEAIVTGDAMGKKFHPGYLSGFYAEMEDVGSQVYEEYARQTVEDHLPTLLQQKGEHYDLKEKKNNLMYQVGHDRDILRPVWFLARKTKDRVAYAVVNGSDKGVEADMPFDEKKLLKISFITSIVLFAILQLGFTFTPKAMIALTGLFIYGLNAIYFSNIQSIYVREISKGQKKNILEKLPLWLKVLAGILFAIFLMIVWLIWLMDGTLANYCISLFVLEGIHAVRYSKKWMEISKKGTHPTKWILASFLASLILVGISIANPVHDYWYYIGGAVSLVITIITLFKTIGDYNLICSSPLPQFKAYEGGHQDEER